MRNDTEGPAKNHAFTRLIRNLEDNPSKYLSEISINPYNHDDKPPLNTQQINFLFELIEAKGLTKNIKNITFTEEQLEQDCVVDLSAFTGLEVLIIRGNSLNTPPIIDRCQTLYEIDFSNNRLTELPNGLEQLSILRTCNLESNPLNKEAIEQLELLTEQNKKLDTVYFMYDVQGTLSDEIIMSWPINKLIKEFVKIVDKKKKSRADIEDIFNISKKFKEKFKDYYENTPADFDALIKKACDDSLFYSNLRHILDFSYGDIWRKVSRNNSDAFPFNCSALDALEIEDGLRHYTSHDVWTPDFSFLDRNRKPVQKPLGKERKGKPSLPKGMMLPMKIERWGENAVYLNPSQKKQLKIRKENNILIRDIDKEKNRLKIPSEIYNYVLSTHGGLTAVTANDFDDLHYRLTYHSAFRAGQYVMCAGEIIVDDEGKITNLNSNSGHMMPPDINLFISAIYLYSKGIIEHDCIVSPYTHEEITVRELISNLDKYIHDEKTLHFVMNNIVNQSDKSKCNDLIDIEDLGKHFRSKNKF